MAEKIVTVVISNTFSNGYDYLVADNQKDLIGKRVKVNFRNRIKVGVICY